MNPTVRLQRINRRLTAQERAILCVRASQSGEPEDPAIRVFMPREQIEEFNWYLALSNTALNLVPIAAIFRMEVGCRMMHLGSVLQSSSAADEVLAKEVVPAFRKLWATLLAWERLCDEIGKRFGDPVIVPAGMNGILEHARELLTDWHTVLKPEVSALRLPRIDSAVLDDLREVVRRQQELYL